MATKYEQIEKRIMGILGKQDADEIFRCDENLKRYLKYLKEHLAFPCLLTGMEDFPWEERYVFGYGEQREYEELKKTNPSYTDTFSLPGSENLALETGSLNALLTQLKERGITQKALAEGMGMNPHHLAAIKSSEQRNRYFNELGATKLACLWVIEHCKGAE